MKLFCPISILLTLLLVSCEKKASLPPSADTLKYRVESAIDRALRFIVRKQSAQGGWHGEGQPALKNGPGLSALALYALVSVPPDRLMPYQKSVERGLRFLLDHQDEEGCLYALEDFPNYTTALGILTLCRYKPAGWEIQIKPLVAYLKQAQLTETYGWTEDDLPYGGWDLGKPKHKPVHFRTDLSVTTFALEALRAAGVSQDDLLWKKAQVFIARCHNFPRQGQKPTPYDDGGFFFSPWISKAGQVSLSDTERRFASYGSMTCDGLRSLLACGQPLSDQRIQAGIAWLRDRFILTKNPGFPDVPKEAFDAGTFFYYLYSLSRTLDNAEFRDIETPQGKIAWAPELAKCLLQLQRPDGSWVNTNSLMMENEPLLATSLGLLVLQTAYRWLK